MPMHLRELGPPSCWTTDYWLWHCEGFRVFTGEGPIGFVEEVLGSPDDGPRGLVVRVGEVFTHSLTIPTEAIEGFDPANERVLVASLAGLDPRRGARQLEIPAAV